MWLLKYAGRPTPKTDNKKVELKKTTKDLKINKASRIDCQCSDTI